MNARNVEPHWKIEQGFIATLISFALIAILLSILGWKIAIPYLSFEQNWQRWPDLQNAISGYALSLLGIKTDGWLRILQIFQGSPLGVYKAFLFHLYAPIITAIPLSIGIGWLAAYPQDTIHKRGPRLFSGKRAIDKAQSAAKKDGVKQNPGLWIHPEIQLAGSLDTGGVFAMGSPGSGKTQILWPMLMNALAGKPERRAIVLDNKGDFTELTHPDWSSILAPWDTRSAAWDIAKDVVTELDAELFAASTISVAKGDNAVFGNAARILLTGFMVCLQQLHAQNWGWIQLAECIEWPSETIIANFEKYYPIGLKVFKDNSKTSDSIMTNLISELAFIRHFAKAWPDSVNKFSLRTWIADGSKYKPVLLLQVNKSYPLLSDSFGCAVLSLLAQIVLSPQMPDSRSRRIFFLLDEIAQIPRVEQLNNLCAVGRSKGVSVWIGLQDIGLLAKNYGKEEVHALIGMLRTKVTLHMGEGPGAEFAAGLLGKREIEIKDVDDKGKTRNSRIETQQLVLPGEINGLPSASLKGGAHGWLSVAGWDATLKLRWPIRQSKKIRQGVELASWIHTPAPSLQIDQINLEGTSAPKKRLIKKSNLSDGDAQY